MKKSIITILLVFTSLNLYAFQDFPVSMFYVPNTQSDLEMIAEGNIKYVFADRGIDDDVNISYYEDFIKNADNASSITGSEIYIYVTARFKSAANWDNEMSQNEFDDLTDNITQVLDIQDSLLTNNIIDRNRIRGWIIEDEPLKYKYEYQRTDNPNNDLPVSEFEAYSNNLKTFLGDWDNENGYEYDKMVVTEGSSIFNVLDPNPNDLFVRQDYSLYANAYDEIHINYYFSDINNEARNLYDFEPFDLTDDPVVDFPTGWYANQGEGSLRALSLIWQKVQNDLEAYPDKKVHMMLSLGKTDNMEKIISHEKTHAGIRKVKALGFDGVSFFVWKTESVDSDAHENWTTSTYNYKEAVLTEVQDTDWLATSLTNSAGTQNRTYLSNRGNGQLPAAGYNEDHSTTIKHLATGDLWGEQGYDFTYVINNTDDRKSIADGDDELVYTTEDEDFWISEENHTVSTFGDELDSNQSASTGEEITAMTTGDFDGDADSEVVTAVYGSYGTGPTYYSRIYISQEGKDFKQELIYESESPYTFLVPKITALAAGDFKGNGRDELVTASYNEYSAGLFIYLSDIAEDDSLTSQTITSNTSSSFYVSHFAVGDFDGDYQEEIATAFRNSSGDYSMLTISRPKPGGAAGNPGWGNNKVWESSVDDEIITALAAGDFHNERKDSLITAFWNSSTNESEIYQSGHTFDTSSGGGGDPTQGDLLYSGTYWHVSAMAAGSFRESLPQGSSKIAVQDKKKDSEQVTHYSLEQNYPNPFNPVTTITYSIPQNQQVKLQVFDVLGRLVTTLVNDRKQAGTYSVNFDASTMSSGVYIYKLEAGTFTQTKMFTLVK